MSVSRSIALPAATAILVITGCNGAATPASLTSSNVTQIGATRSATIPALGLGLSPNFVGGAPARDPAKGRSWMSPNATSETLWYVADTSAGAIFIYSWQKKQAPVGEITGLSQPYTFCVDKAQDVYVADLVLQEVLEYTHGGTTPIKTLGTGGGAISCSVDPTTGNLAVANYELPSAPGNVLVYRGASGNPTAYSAPNITDYFFVGYDAKGNLFVDGQGSSGFGLAEMPAGSSSFEAITINVAITFPGGVQWDGKYLDVGDQKSNTIYQFAVSGTSATEKGSVDLVGTSDVFQFFIPKFGSAKNSAQGNRLVAADYGFGESSKFLYPTGGTALRTLFGFSQPEGAIVSKGMK